MKRYVNSTDGTVLAVSEVGPPDAPLSIVFAHGLALSQHIWAPQRRHLTRQLGARARLVFYDQRGHGASQEPAAGPAGYSMAQLGADLATIIDQTCPIGPVIAVGHSLGGMAILALAHHRPEIAARLAGAALISTAANHLSTCGIGRALNTPALSWLEYIARRAPRITHHTWNLGRTAAGPLLGVPLTYTAAQHTVTIRALVGILTALRTHDETGGLPALQALPACLIACGQADPVTPLHHSLTLSRQLPNARLLTAARAGHMLPVERPDLINAALAALATQALSGHPVTAQSVPA
jgi:pimeloyl-ACP methyl ester carboxylesterase